MRLKMLLSILLLLVAGKPVSTQASSTTDTVHLTLADLGVGDLTLQGMYGTATTWIPFPSNRVLADEMQVDVTYVASPLLHPQRATLTVLANEQEQTSIRPVAGGSEHTFSFTIPPDLLQGEGVSIRFQANLRLTDDECEETNNPGQWLTIDNTTSFSLATAEDEQPPDLSNLPQPIVVRNALEAPPPMLFVLPENPSEAALTASARVAARLAQDAGVLPPLQATTAAALTPAQKEKANLVIAGVAEEQPLLSQLASDLPATLINGRFRTADSRLSGDGIIQTLNAPWNPARKILVVSGADRAGLVKAGQAFADRFTYRELHGKFQFVNELANHVKPQPGQPWLDETTTFAQLGADERTVRGTGIFDEYYYFQRPPGWILDQGSQLTLNLAFSPALRSQESYVAAFINDVYVGTVRTGAGIEKTSATFDLPVAMLNQTPRGERSQTLVLRLMIANIITPVNQCHQIHPQTAWTQISSTSFLRTPHVYLALPDLQAFPYPFVSEQPQAPVSLVVPPRPNIAELEQALSMAATLGRAAPADFELHLVTADNVSSQSHGNHHLIVLGQRSRQPLVDTLLDELGSVPGYDGKRDLYQALAADHSALLREAPSPWNEERLVLITVAASERGFELAGKALSDVTALNAQPGSVALVEAERPLRIIYRPVTAAPLPERGAVLREPLIPHPQPWMVITAVLMITTVLILGALWFSRRQPTQPD